MKQLYQPRRIHFLTAFVLIVIALAITKCVNPQLALPRLLSENDSIKNKPKHVPDSIELQAKRVDGIFLKERNRLTLLKKDGSPVKNRVTSVPRFETSFPDLNDVQLATASRLGIPMIENRDEAHHRMKIWCISLIIRFILFNAYTNLFHISCLVLQRFLIKSLELLMTL